MHREFPRRKFLSGLWTFSRLLAVMLIAGCGGGTGGSDGGTPVKVAGYVFNVNGQPLEAVTVTSVETEDSTITDQTGAFELNTSTTSEEIELRLERDGVEGSVVVGAQIKPQAVVSVVLTFDPTNGSASVEDLAVDKLDPPESESAGEVTDEPDDKSFLSVTLIDEDRAPVVGAKVYLLDPLLGSSRTLQSSQSNERGKLSFEFSTRYRQIVIRVHYKDFKLGATFRNLPHEASEISTRIRVELPPDLAGSQGGVKQDRGKLVIESRQVKRRENRL